MHLFDEPINEPGSNTPPGADDPIEESSRDNPVQLGLTGVQGDWEITVLGTTPDATELVLAENQFNDPPKAGNQFYMANVRMQYLGPESERPRESRLKALGNKGVLYSALFNDCGVIPDDFPILVELFTGGQVEGNVCWEVHSDEVESLVMVVEPEFLHGDDRLWMALTP